MKVKKFTNVLFVTNLLLHSGQKCGKEENIIQDDNDTIEDEEYFPENNHDNLKSMVLAPANSSKI